MKYLTSIVGPKHLKMLVTLIESVSQIPHSQMSIYWQDIASEIMSNLKKAYPSFAFQKTSFSFPEIIRQRVSLKTKIWSQALEIETAKNICFLDVDTLVLKPIDHYFDQSFDIGITHKPGKFPLNSGVLLVKNSEKTKRFFERWAEETTKIVYDPTQLQTSYDPTMPYGGADQMSLYQLIQYQHQPSEIHLGDDNIRLRYFPCEELNETRSTPITQQTHIAHFKGGWQPILLNNANFTRERSKESSWPLYKKYLSVHLRALSKLKQARVSSLTVSMFSLSIPWFIDQHLNQNRFLYPLYYVCHVPHDMVIKCKKILQKRNVL